MPDIHKINPSPARESGQVPWFYIGSVEAPSTAHDYELGHFFVEMHGIDLIVVEIQLLAALKMPKWQVVGGASTVPIWQES